MYAGEYEGGASEVILVWEGIVQKRLRNTDLDKRKIVNHLAFLMRIEFNNHKST